MSHTWQNILIGPSETIQNALKVIDNEALKLALVVDDNNKLLGTLSDGDIRRALIGGVSLNVAVSEVMNTNPTTAVSEQTRGSLLEIMERKELFSIPILCNGIVIGLETLHHIVQKKTYENPVFLMAGGFGTRLKPLTDNCPKPLLKVGDKPILETVIKSFINSGFSNFFISTHYLPEMISEYFGDGQQWGVSITYIHEDKPLGTGGALGLLPKNRSKLPVIVMNGDVLTKIDFEKLLEFHNHNKASATMCVREYEYQVPFGVVESHDYKIQSLVEKPIQRFHVNAGIYVIGKKILDSVEHNEYIDMPSLFEKHLSDQLLVYPFHEYWLDIGRMDDFSRAQEDYKTLGF